MESGDEYALAIQRAPLASRDVGEFVEFPPRIELSREVAGRARHSMTEKRRAACHVCNDSAANGALTRPLDERSDQNLARIRELRRRLFTRQHQIERSAFMANRRFLTKCRAAVAAAVVLAALGSTPASADPILATGTAPAAPEAARLLAIDTWVHCGPPTLVNETRDLQCFVIHSLFRAILIAPLPW